VPFVRNIFGVEIEANSFEKLMKEDKLLLNNVVYVRKVSVCLSLLVWLCDTRTWINSLSAPEKTEKAGKAYTRVQLYRGQTYHLGKAQCAVDDVKYHQDRVYCFLCLFVPSQLFVVEVVPSSLGESKNFSRIRTVTD